MSAAGLFTALPSIKNPTVSAYSRVTGVSPLIQAAKAKDKETFFENITFLFQSAALFSQTYASLVTGVSIISARFFCASIFKRKRLISLATGNLIGITSCSIEALIELRGFLQCRAFLNKHTPSFDFPFIKELDHTSTIKDPLEKKEKRLQIIEKILPHLKASPHFKQIQSVFKDVLGQEMQRESALLTLKKTEYTFLERLQQLLTSSPKAEEMKYAELIQEIEIASLFSLIQDFKKTYIEVSEEKIERLTEKSLQKHPFDIRERELFKNKRREREENKKRMELNRYLGEFFTNKLNKRIDVILNDLYATDPLVRERACSESKQLLEKIQNQAEKSCVIHQIGLIAATISAISFAIALFITCPLCIPIILGIIGTLIYALKYLLSCGLLEQEGHPSITNPDFWALCFRLGFIDPIFNKLESVKDQLRDVSKKIITVFHTIPQASKPETAPTGLFV